MGATAKFEDPEDIVIPVIEIVAGWAADSMETMEDCEDAMIKCNAMIAEIEYQIDLHTLTISATVRFGIGIARKRRRLVISPRRQKASASDAKLAPPPSALSPPPASRSRLGLPR
jgi:hypothetical protein